MSKSHTASPLYAYLRRGTPLDQSLPDEITEGVVESCIIKDQRIQKGNFSNTRFRRLVFQNCKLIDCDFSGAELMETRIINCDLTGSDFSGSIWSDTVCWLVKGFDIHSAKLTNAVFEDCNLSIDDLSDCITEGVELYT